MFKTDQFVVNTKTGQAHPWPEGTKPDLNPDLKVTNLEGALPYINEQRKLAGVDPLTIEQARGEAPVAERAPRKPRQKKGAPAPDAAESDSGANGDE
jgi:hypothetical protein